MRRYGSVDSSQFVERARKRDFDIMYSGWGESLNPGNEQAEYWGSKSASDGRHAELCAAFPIRPSTS
ncbi:MAG: hypothetical protein QM811_03220 [Pirellulales bacterium]